jgi:hypothetical protein
LQGQISSAFSLFYDSMSLFVMSSLCTIEQMNLVDTPGTNVILQRQQRLTEEYVPRADLILFVLSSDRPLTESEVRVIIYYANWLYTL